MPNNWNKQLNEKYNTTHYYLHFNTTLQSIPLEYKVLEILNWIIFFFNLIG